MKLLIKSKKAEREGHTKRLAKLQKDSDKAEKSFDAKRLAWEKTTKERVEGQQKAEAARNDATMAPIKVKKLDMDVTALESKEAAAKAEYDIARDSVEKFRRKLYVDLRLSSFPRAQTSQGSRGHPPATRPDRTFPRTSAAMAT